MSKEKGIKRASSKANNNNNTIKGQATKITSFFHCEKVIRSSSRPQFFTEEVIDVDEKQQLKQFMSEDQMIKEAMQRSLEENVKEFESNNDSYMSEREQYIQNYESKQDFQVSEDQKKKKQQRNRKEEEENDTEKENDDDQSDQIKESKQQKDQDNSKKIIILDVEEEEDDLMEKKIKLQLAAIPSEDEDDIESDNELKNQNLIPKEIYCLPQTERLSWQFKSRILKELSDKKHTNKYSGYAQIYNLYSRSNDRVNLDSLKNYIDDRLKEPERVDFFSKLLPFIAQLALEIQNLPHIPFLIASKEAEVVFTRKQIASLLAGMFLGVLLSQKQKDLPYGSSFRTMLAGSINYKNSRKIEKISCIVHYFKRIQATTKEQLNEKVSFHRLVFNPQLHKNSNISVFWKQSQKPLSEVIHSKEASIEDFDETVQVDFANEFIGGGVLDHGLVQEEIRFLVSPELIISRLFCPKIEDHEAILIVGSEQFSSYEGYGDTFKFSGDKVEKPIGTNTQGFRKSAVLAIDAINYSQSYDKKIQYKMQTVVRELLKSYVGFECSKQLLQMEGQKKMNICTGRWGCGIFGGDPQLKFVIQWMSASEAERGMIFCSFKDKELSEIEKIVRLLKNKKVNEVFAMIHKYTEYVNKQNIKSTLFQFAEIYCGK